VELMLDGALLVRADGVFRHQFLDVDTVAAVERHAAR
jgi:hypothetical protein